MINKLACMDGFEIKKSEYIPIVTKQRFVQETFAQNLSTAEVELVHFLMRYPFMLTDNISDYIKQEEKDLTMYSKAYQSLKTKHYIDAVSLLDKNLKNHAGYAAINPYLAEEYGYTAVMKRTTLQVQQIASTVQAMFGMRKERRQEDLPAIKKIENVIYGEAPIYPYRMLVISKRKGSDIYPALELLSKKMAKEPLRQRIVIVCESFNDCAKTAKDIFDRTGLHLLTHTYFTFDRAFSFGFLECMYLVRLDGHDPVLDRIQV